MSHATEHYLAPETNLGEAVLRLTTQQDVETHEIKHFVCEIFDPYLQTVTLPNGTTQQLAAARAPSSIRAASFFRRRFKHGYEEISRKNVHHPIARVPITDYTVNLIQYAWTNKKIISPTAQSRYDEIFLREFLADQNASRTAQFKINGIVPTGKWFDAHYAELSLRMIGNKPITVSPYQKCAAYNSCHTDKYAFFAAPGTGKTLMSIIKLDYLIDHSPIDPTTGKPQQILGLIACPKSVRTNWVSEIEQFSTNNSSIYIHMLNGSDELKRSLNFIEALFSDEARGKHFIVICGYESFVKTPKLHEQEWKFCFFDESHNIASPTTARTKTFLENSPHFEHKLILTGTPFRNTEFDSYPQFEFLGEGVSGFESFPKYKAFYGEYSPPAYTSNGDNKGSQLIGILEDRIPLLQEKIAKYAFVISKKEALPFLPDKTYSRSEYNLTLPQSKAYRQIAEELMAMLESYGPEPEEVVVQNFLVQMLRLHQVTSGFVPTSSGEIYRFDPNPKLDLLVSLLLGDKDNEIEGCLEDKNQKAIVWCAFKENIKMIRARMDLEGIKCVQFHGGLDTDEKEEAKLAYNNDPETRLIVGIAASGGVGLNLVGYDAKKPDWYTTNTTDTFYYSSNWSAIDRAQSEDRGHRHNTRVPQHITDMLCPNSIDMEIYCRVQGKIKMSSNMQDLRRILTTLVPQTNGA